MTDPEKPTGMPHTNGREPAPPLMDLDPGEEIYALASELYPICRSITGSGVQTTLDLLARHIPIERHALPTGTKVLDWEIPREWNITDAYIKDAAGNRLIDFRASNLHVVGYSTPVHCRMDMETLRPHIFTLPDQPGLIPYRTSYYAETWGFCMSQNQLATLEAADGPFEVVIDSMLTDGMLTWGEYLHKGDSADEILLSTHLCHPSLANDNCSGLALQSIFAKLLSTRKTRYSYRFLFVPGTIGAIAWLAQNDADVQRIKHGLVLSCVGDGGGPTYKKSRRGTALIDRAMGQVLCRPGLKPNVIDFFPYGYDERQYCSPGYDLPVGLFQRSQFGTFPEYHTSADDLSFISPEHLGESFRWIAEALDIVERDRTFLNLHPKGEPQLGRRGLYAGVGGDKDAARHNMAMLWVLNLSDGSHSLLDIAERSKLPFAAIAAAADALHDHGLVADTGGSGCGAE